MASILCRAIPKDVTKWYSQLSCFALSTKESVESKPASLLVVSSAKALNGMVLPLRGRQVVKSENYPSWLPWAWGRPKRQVGSKVLSALPSLMHI